MMLNQEINNKKLNLNQVYNLREPEPYYQSINQYEYDLPERAKPYFQKIINTYRHYESLGSLKILDIGCSYGINAAILKFNKSIAEIYQHYTNPLRLQRSELSRRHLDSKWFHESSLDENLQFIGLDSAEKAVNYATESQLIQSGISTNLEKLPLLKEHYTNLQDINLLISTGCIGYITEITLDKILSAVRNLDQLWGAVFVLKMFDISGIKKTFAKYNLALVETGVTVKQRKFSSVEEKQSMINFLEKQGLSAEDEKESDNLLAQLFLILPPPVTNKPLIKKLLDDMKYLGR
ncbi:MAG: hypothetical protein VKL59_02650 [Nostocaceae cyanobacterium]|nr:hypothetical protein [Nostocaceae cyanobacterium]